MERRKISKEVYDKIIKQIPNKIIEMLPDKPENLLRYATRIKEVQFSKNVDEPTKKLMKEKLLSDEEYLRTFFFVMAITFYNKKRVENPQIKIVAAQTGSGKSNLTAKLLREDENYIFVDSDKYKHFRYDAKDIANEYQVLYPFLTGYDNMKLIDEDPDNKNIDLIIKELKMEKFIHTKVKTYSLGMKQKLGIALAFLNHPQLVILDEPMNGLDPKAVKNVREAIISLREQGVTFLISSHILSELVKVTDSILIIDDGEIIKETTMDELNQSGESDLENVLLNIIDRKEEV